MRSLLSAVLAVVATAGFVAVAAPAAAESAARSTARAAAPGPASQYTSVAPVRVLDTRNGSGAVGAGRTISLNLSSRVPAGATAVVLNVTGVSPTAATFVTAFPSGESRPVVSNLNLAAGETRANLVTVRVGSTRTVSLYNHAGSTHLVADLAGFYSTGAGAKFTPRQADRVFATSLGPQDSILVDLDLYVPESATAVTLNVTGTRPTSNTFLTVWPAGTARPLASTVNLAAGKTNPNLTTVALGEERRVLLYNHAGTIDVFIDLSGFYTPEFGASFVPVTPARIFDTRTGAGTGDGVVRPIATRENKQFHPGAQVPDDAVAAVLNMTGINPSQSTFVTAWLEGFSGPPPTSNLNLAAGQIAANLAVVPTQWENPDFRAFFYNANGRVDLAGDLAGYFTVPPVPCDTDCAYSWGANFGRLGVGTTTPLSLTPSPVSGLTGVTAVADRYALRADGTVWAWGYNGTGDLGGGWIGGWSTVAAPVSGLTNAVAVASGFNSGYALRADGTVWAWGQNLMGQLGTGNTDMAPAPVRVAGLSEVTAIAGGWDSAYALRADGTVWAWGNNSVGQLGNGSTANSASPVRVSGLSEVTAIAAGSDTAYALLADGTVRSWGSNRVAQLGDGSTAEQSLVPVQVSGLSGVRVIAGDSSHGFALREDGTVWGWGDGGNGGLGNGVDCNINCETRVPVRVLSPAGAVDVEGSGGGGYVLDGAGRVWAWGSNTSGELGQGRTFEYQITPVQVPNLPVVASLEPGRFGGRVLVPNR